MNRVFNLHWTIGSNSGYAGAAALSKSLVSTNKIFSTKTAAQKYQESLFDSAKLLGITAYLSTHLNEEDID